MTTLEAIEMALRRAGLSTSDSTYQGQMRDYLTLACRDIESAATWWWLFKSSTFDTVADTQEYALATDCVQPLSFRDTTSNHNLRIVSPQRVDAVDPESDDTGTPEWIYIAGADSSTGAVSVGIHPTPDDVYTIAYRYYGTVADFTTTHDSWDLRESFGIPSNLQHALAFAAARYYQQQLGDDEGSMVNFAEYSRILKDAVKTNGRIQGNRAYRLERPENMGRLFQPQEGSLS